MIRVELNALSWAISTLSAYTETLRICASQSLPLKLNADFANRVAIAHENLVLISDRLKLPVAAHLASNAQRAYKTTQKDTSVTGHEVSSYMAAVKELLNQLYQETKSRRALVLETEAVELYEQTEPLFGEAVSLKFAKASTDVAEAGKCFALDRPTACVFHLMRVAECGVQALGKRLKVQVDVERESWYKIVQHVNNAVDAMPAKTPAQQRRKQKYGAAAAHLNAVRIATRNDVMHPKATYTLDEASVLMDATKQLMQQLAEIV